MDDPKCQRLEGEIEGRRGIGGGKGLEGGERIRERVVGRKSFLSFVSLPPNVFLRIERCF